MTKAEKQLLQYYQLAIKRGFFLKNNDENIDKNDDSKNIIINKGGTK